MVSSHMFEVGLSFGNFWLYGALWVAFLWLMFSFSACLKFWIAAIWTVEIESKHAAIV